MRLRCSVSDFDAHVFEQRAQHRDAVARALRRTDIFLFLMRARLPIERDAGYS
jgi:hypothetical protein